MNPDGAEGHLANSIGKRLFRNMQRRLFIGSGHSQASIEKSALNSLFRHLAALVPLTGCFITTGALSLVEVEKEPNVEALHIQEEP